MTKNNLKDFKCIILAAGEGSRMKSSLPKVLQPVCGKPMLGYILKVIAKAGVKEVIVVVNAKSQGKQIKDFLGKSVKTVEQKQLLGARSRRNSDKRIIGKIQGQYSDNLRRYAFIDAADA